MVLDTITLPPKYSFTKSTSSELVRIHISHVRWLENVSSSFELIAKLLCSVLRRLSRLTMHLSHGQQRE